MDWIQTVLETYFMLLMILVPAFAVAAGIGAYRLSCWLEERNPIRIEYAPGQRLLRREKAGNGNGPAISKCVGRPIGGAERWW